VCFIAVAAEEQEHELSVGPEVRRARTLELLAARYAGHAVLVGRHVH
jgi:hypothetical protein